MPAAKHYSAGQIFAHLTYLGEAPRHIKTKRRLSWFRCTCGKVVDLQPNLVERGHTKSCGCMARFDMINANTKHGRCGKKDRTYKAWCSMNERCFTPTHQKWKDYGGRGITVCQRWRESFENFLADMGDMPPGKSLYRYPNNDGNYEPGNCRWATWPEQQNNRRSTRFIEFDGRRLSVTQWANHLGISMVTLSGRLKKGWPLERALSPEKRALRPKRFVEFNGERLSISEWSERIGISVQALGTRLDSGWPVDKALTMPPDPWTSRRAFP